MEQQQQQQEAGAAEDYQYFEVEETQLALTRPQMGSQLRVQAAPNTPDRSIPITDDHNSFLGKTIYSPFSMVQTPVFGALINSRPNAIPMSAAELEQQALVKNSLKDYYTMALSSNRAGKKDIEALAYSSLGIMHDNLGNFKLALGCYSQYLQICIDLNDISGQRKALNFLGTDSYLLAQRLNENSDSESKDSATKYVLAAIEYHTRHLKSADDAGKFVAYNNLGVCFDLADNLIESAKNHQSALRIAIKIQSLHGQSVAVGNLGKLAQKKGDSATAKTCFEQHLQLTQTLQDTNAEINAWKMIAFLYKEKDDLDQAQESLEHARAVAMKYNLSNELRILNCSLGEIIGMKNFDAHASKLLESLHVKS